MDEQQAERMLVALQGYVARTVSREVKCELPKHIKSDLDFLQIIVMLEKRVRMLETRL